MEKALLLNPSVTSGAVTHQPWFSTALGGVPFIFVPVTSQEKESVRISAGKPQAFPVRDDGVENIIIMLQANILSRPDLCIGRLQVWLKKRKFPKSYLKTNVSMNIVNCWQHPSKLVNNQA